MGKSLADAVLDGALDVVATATRLDVTSDAGTPTNYTGTLAKVTLTAGDGNGDYTIANYSAGRTLTVSQQADISVTGSGTAKHVMLSISSGPTILLTTTCTDQALTTGNTVTVPAFVLSISDPT